MKRKTYTAEEVRLVAETWWGFDWHGLCRLGEVSVIRETAETLVIAQTGSSWSARPGEPMVFFEHRVPRGGTQLVPPVFRTKQEAVTNQRRALLQKVETAEEQLRQEKEKLRKFDAVYPTGEPA